MKQKDLFDLIKGMNPDAEVVFSNKRGKEYDFTAFIDVSLEDRLKPDSTKIKKCKKMCIQLTEKVEETKDQVELKFEKCVTCGQKI